MIQRYPNEDAPRPSPFVLAFAFASLSLAQEIPVLKNELDQMAKLGVVKLSGPTSVELVVPDGFMGDAVHGRVLLINDGEAAATISDVSTSCGCTSAIPVERIVSAGRRNLLLITYHPKAPGTRLLEARFTYGNKEFHLTGKAITHARFVQTTRTLEFDENGSVQVEVHKPTKTPLDRLVVFPSTLRVTDFEDRDEVFRAKIQRDPKRTTPDITIVPALGATEYSPIDFELRYPGLFEVLPRRVVVTGSSVSFFVRGEVDSLADSKDLTVIVDGKERVLPCELSLVGPVLRVVFQSPFESGDYRANVKIKDASFPLLVTVR